MRKGLFGFLVAGLTILVASIGISVIEEYSSENPPSNAQELAARLFPDALGEPEPRYIPDEEIYEYSAAIDFTEAGEKLFFDARPEIHSQATFGDACSAVNSEPGVGVLGCYYSGTDRIYLYDVTDPRLTGIEPVVAAHEMLHAAWYRLSLERRAELEVQLMDAFLSLPNDHAAVKRLKNYVNSAPESLATELHSILGTEVVELPAELEAHYAAYFNNRPELALRAQEAYSIFTETQEQALVILNEIYAWDSVLDETREQLRIEDAALTAAILDFNDRNTRGDFATKSEYNAERETLENRKLALEVATIAFNEAVFDFNERVEELENLNSLLKELNQGLNIPEKN